MKIARHYKPELVASQDDERFNLWDPFLDVPAKRLVATDGFRLVAVPVEIDEDDASGYVSRDLLKIGRKKADELQPVEIRKCTDLRPHRIEWPVLQERKFPDWRAVVPPYREGDDGTITIGLNSRLLKGIADALGSDGIVALTVQVSSLATSPIVVRSLTGDRGEVGILMPCKVDDRTRDVAPPAPVMDLPPTESEKRKAAKEAGADPDEPESMDLPGVPPAPPAEAVLTWVEEGRGVQAASVPTGRYEVAVVEGLADATWIPWRGKTKVLASKLEDPAAAKDACTRHNTERMADALLKNAGAGELTKADTKGPAVARKRGGRRG